MARLILCWSYHLQLSLTLVFAFRPRWKGRKDQGRWRAGLGLGIFSIPQKSRVAGSLTEKRNLKWQLLYSSSFSVPFDAANAILFTIRCRFFRSRGAWLYCVKTQDDKDAWVLQGRVAFPSPLKHRVSLRGRLRQYSSKIRSIYWYISFVAFANPLSICVFFSHPFSPFHTKPAHLPTKRVATEPLL